MRAATVFVFVVAGCVSTPPKQPDPLAVGDNIYLLKRDSGRPYLEWADGLQIAENFCGQRREGKAEIMTVTEPDHIAFQCELGVHEKLDGNFRVFSPRPRASD